MEELESQDVSEDERGENDSEDEGGKDDGEDERGKEELDKDDRNFVESFAGPEFGFKITRILNVLLLTQISAKMYCSQTSIKH